MAYLLGVLVTGLVAFLAYIAFRDLGIAPGRSLSALVTFVSVVAGGTAMLVVRLRQKWRRR
jgi:hypothetical protein